MRKNKSVNSVGNEDGSVLIICALTLSVLLGFAALAIDIGYAYMRIAQLQTVADAQSLACARDYTNCTGVGSQFPLANPYGFTVAMQKGVTCPDTSTQQNCVQANTSTVMNTYFLPLFGISTLNLGKTAIAGKRIASDAMIIRGLVSMNGTNIMTVSNGSVAIGGGISTTNQSGIDATASGSSITVFNNSSNSCGNCTPAVKSSSSPLPTVPPYNLPSSPTIQSSLPACIGNPATATYPQGTYNFAVAMNCANNVMNGIYYFNQGLNNQGNTLNGVNTTIIVGVDQDFQLSGTVNLNSGTVGNSTCGTADGGMLVYQPVTLTNTYHGITVSGAGNNINLTGIVQLPNTDLTFKGSPTSLSVTGTLYIDSLDFRGNMSASTSPDPCQNLNISAANTILVQ